MNCLKCGADLQTMAECKECGTPNPYMDDDLRNMVRKLSYSAAFVVNGQPSLLAFDLNHDICVLCDCAHGAQSFPLHLLKETREKRDGRLFNPSVKLLEQYSMSAALGCQATVDDNISHDCGQIVKRSDVIFVLKDETECCFSLLSRPIFITAENDYGLLRERMRVLELLTRVMNDLAGIFSEYTRQLKNYQQYKGGFQNDNN